MSGKLRFLFRRLEAPALAATLLALLAASPAPLLADVVPREQNVPASTWFVDMNRFSVSAHAALSCEACHGTMLENGAKHPDTEAPGFLTTPATRRFDYARCQPCHQKAYERYSRGGHAEALKKEQEAPAGPELAAKAKTPAPTCGECHPAHTTRSSLSRLETGANMVATCGKCHPEHAKSYMDNVHGRKGVDLKDPDAAFCTDCHGAHTTVSLKEKKDAVNACVRCHRKADTAFADIIIHQDMPENPEKEAEKAAAMRVIHRVRVVVGTLFAFVLIFFFSHSSVWVLKEIHEKLRKR